MNANDTNKITSRENFFMLIQFQIGIGLLSLPHTIYPVAGKSAWLFIFLLGILIQIVTILFWLLGRQFPNQSFFEYIPSLIGPCMAKIVTFLFILYFLISGCMIIFYFGHILKGWVLPHTPLWFIHLLLIGTAVYATMKGLQNIGYFLLLSFPCVIVLFLLLNFGLTNLPLSHLLPLSSFNFSSIFLSSKEYILTFTGFEAFLFFYPYIKGSEKQKIKSALLANLFVIISYVYVVLISFLHLTSSQIQYIKEPIIYLLKTLPISAFFRVDLVFLSLWIVCVTTSLILYVYLTSYSLQSLLHIKRRTCITIGTAILMYLFSLLPQQEGMLHFLTNLLAGMYFIMTIFLPCLLLVISYMKRRRIE
ncbi:GerAB/ArcD/ProY family transporter [Bacillus cereus group sp. BceL062]|uniref:GerAB/ArcD/ProY family transporter n=1 Tax=Bacillus cereus group sp. BceL062 TaxID=3445166 RepID=UPI003F26677B